MKIQSWLKSLSQKYDPYLTWVLLTLVIISIPWNIYSIYKDITLEQQRKQAQERLDNLFQQGDKLREKSELKKAELEKVNEEAKQCLKQTNPELNECESILNKSVALTQEFKTISQEYKQLIINVDKNYCFLYPDATDKKCQQISQ